MSRAAPATRLALLLAVLAFLFPATVHAQVGGLVKKARDRVAGTGQQPAADQAARLPGPALTSDVVNRLLTGLTAEKRARDREAQEAERRRVADSVARAERERPGYYATREECIQVKMKSDKDWPEIERLMNEGQAAAQRNDLAKAGQIAQRMVPLQQQIQQRSEAACASMPSAADAQPATPTERAVQMSRDSLEGLGAGASGFTKTEYAQLKELVYTYLVYPQKAGLTPDEKRVVDPKKAQLKEALKGVGIG